jgi:hypothetical protein
MHPRHMPIELVRPRKRLRADLADVRPRAGVCAHVFREVARLSEGLFAVRALEGLVARVGALVDGEGAGDGKGLAAAGDVAFVWL